MVADATRDIALRVIGQSPDSGRHECRAGCAFCCHTAVSVVPPEAIAIREHLRRQYTARELEELQRRIASNAETASRMTRAEYVAASVRCALLTDDGNCRVHAVRPLACAGFLSTSQAACEGEFDRMPGRVEVPIDRYAMVAGLSAAYGLKEACQQAGMDGEAYELHHALQRIWDRADAAAAWSAGESLFDGCLRADEW
jgi:Fe-S-cluster containining protein